MITDPCSEIARRLEKLLLVPEVDAGFAAVMARSDEAVAAGREETDDPAEAFHGWACAWIYLFGLAVLQSRTELKSRGQDTGPLLTLALASLRLFASTADATSAESEPLRFRASVEVTEQLARRLEATLPVPVS